MSSKHLHSDPNGFLSSNQTALVNPYLDPHKVKLDERKLPELMAFLAKISDQFWYYDLNDRKQGDWSDFFKTDLTALLASISQKSRDDEYDKVLDFLNGIPYTRKNINRSDFLWEVFSRVFNAVLEVNDWYFVMTQYHVNNNFQSYLNQIIWQKISFNFKTIYALYFEAIKEEVIDDKEKVDNMFKRLQQLQSIWNFVPFPELNQPSTGSKRSRAKAYIASLESAVKDFYHLYTSIVNKAEEEFYKSLKTGQVQPHIALLASFLKTYKHQQKALNHMVPRHLKFYYEDVLDFHKNGASADSTYLLFTLNKSIEAYGLNAKTQLAAGADAQGNPLIFQTDKDLMVVPSVVNNYLTMLSTGQPSSTDLLARSFVTSAVTGYGKPVIDKNTGKYQNFYMFGQPAQPSVSPLPKATLGFAIASPELWMEGGDRELQITFSMADNNSTNGESSEHRKHHKKKKKKKKKKHQDPDDQGQDISSILDFSITGQKKWLSPICTSAIVTQDAFVVTLGFDHGVAAISGYDAKTHGVGYDTAWPVLKANLIEDGKSMSCETMRPNASFAGNAYETLSKIDFSSFTINSTVNNLSIITLKAGGKTVPASATMSPFGSIPAVGDSLLVGSYEAFIKNTNKMCLHINWVNLLSAKDFKDYYKAYSDYLKLYPLSSGPFSFTLDAYQCDLSWLDQGKWQPGASGVELFGKSTCVEDYPIEFEEAETNAAKKKGCSHWKIFQWLHKNKEAKKEDSKKATAELQLINYDVGLQGSISPDYTLTTPLKYTDKSKSGFVSLTLTEPEPAFGNEIYPKVVNWVTLQNTMKVAKKFTIGTALKKVALAIPVIAVGMVLLGLANGPINFPKKTFGAVSNYIGIDASAISIDSDSMTLALNSVAIGKGAIVTSYDTIKVNVKDSTGAIAKDSISATKGSKGLPNDTTSVNKSVLATKDSVLAVKNLGCSSQGVTCYPKTAKSIPTWIVFLVLLGLYIIVSLLSKKKKAFSAVPNKPYVPKAKDVSISYTSDLKVTPGVDNNHQYYRIHPFGIEKVKSQIGGYHLIPEYEAWGYIFLGFEHLYANTTLTLFLGVQDRQDTTISDDFTPLGVDYLSESGWTSTNVLSDTTYGLNKTGIITFQIGENADKNNGIMPVGNYWLRLSGDYKQVAETKLTMLSTNATSASRLMSKSNKWAKLVNIPSGTIKSFIQPVQSVSKVMQPFTSFGGEEPEHTSQFHQRVAQRIGHKERGGSVESIQSIVLDKFREIYGVNVVPGKLLPSMHVPSNTIIITVVPWIDDTSAKDSFQPVAPANMLTEVFTELNNKVSDYLNLEIKHAGFEELKVSVDVVFNQPDQYFELIDQLNEDLQYFMSPWIEGNKLAYKKKSLYVNDVIHFISNREYILSFDHLKICLRGNDIIYDSDDANQQSELQQLINVKDPRNILVSASKHNINPSEKQEAAFYQSENAVFSHPEKVEA